MLFRQAEFDFNPPFDLVPKYLPAEAKNAQEGRPWRERHNNLPFEKSLVWSQLLNEVRTFFEKKAFE